MCDCHENSDRIEKHISALSVVASELRHAVQRYGVEARMARDYLASDSAVMSRIGSKLGMYAREHAREVIGAARELGLGGGLEAVFRCELVRGREDYVPGSRGALPVACVKVLLVDE